MSLLQLADITLHSGRSSFFKLECDALTEADWDAAAGMLAKLLPPFSHVYGVPRGGRRLAVAMLAHETPGATRDLIVDDVWTTGGSMREHKRLYFNPLSRPVVGAVLFARGPVEPWVTPLFTLHEGLWQA